MQSAISRHIVHAGNRIMRRILHKRSRSLKDALHSPNSHHPPASHHPVMCFIDCFCTVRCALSSRLPCERQSVPTQSVYPAMCTISTRVYYIRSIEISNNWIAYGVEDVRDVLGTISVVIVDCIVRPAHPCVQPDRY